MLWQKSVCTQSRRYPWFLLFLSRPSCSLCAWSCLGARQCVKYRLNCRKLWQTCDWVNTWEIHSVRTAAEWLCLFSFYPAQSSHHLFSFNYMENDLNMKKIIYNGPNNSFDTGIQFYCERTKDNASVHFTYNLIQSFYITPD